MIVSNNNLLSLGVHCYYSTVWLILNNIRSILHLQKMMFPEFAGKDHVHLGSVGIPELKASKTNHDHYPFKETTSYTLRKGDCE